MIKKMKEYDLLSREEDVLVKNCHGCKMIDCSLCPTEILLKNIIYPKQACYT